MIHLCMRLHGKINFISQMHNNNTSPIASQSKEAIAWHPNRAYIQLTSSIVVDSCFPGGNIATAAIASLAPLTLQIEGNTDISLDNTSKIRGFRRDRPLKFILKNANHLRKYIGQSRIKPYMVFKEEGQEHWQSLLTPIELCFAENSQLQGSFTFQSQKYFREKRGNLSSNNVQAREEKLTATTAEDNKRASCYFAMYYPYTYQDLANFIIGLKIQHEVNDYSQLVDKKAYFNEETITYSFERRKVSLITITSPNNIESYSEKEPCLSDEIFPNLKDRPYKLKNCPVIFLTARVHPSETSSSYFIEGFIRFLLSDCKASFVLRQIFIFHVIPMLNPDGVEHGNFRFDHQLRNLNRYYGQASIEKTYSFYYVSPSIRAAEIIINYYRNQHQEQSKFTQFHEQTYCRLFLYADVHGHTSALPSFIYGNHTDKVEHMIQNKSFCKMLQCNFIPNGFSKAESQFSKKNMSIQEKYDEFSKLCSGRVFAGRNDSNEHLVYHSYTLEVLPYWEQFSRRKLDFKGQKINATDYSRMLGKAFAATILDILDINPQSRFNDQQFTKLQRNIEKECMNEQSRKLLSFKKVDSNAEHSSNSQYSKNKKQTFHKEYIQRWFRNQIYVKQLLRRQQLIKEVKLLRFFQKISYLTNFGNVQLFQSPRKSRAERSKMHTEPKEMLSELNAVMPKDKIIFVCRKQRGKIESRINKQTLEIRNDFEDLVKNKNQQKEIDFLKYKRQSLVKKQTLNWTDRYENEIVNKIAHEKRKVAFEIKVKQIIPKNKNSRVQTETIASQSSINECPSVLTRNFSKKERQKSTPKRPSFIEEFMMKIRQQREAANVFLNKYDCQQDNKHKGSKMRPTIQEQLEEQEKKMLPILRRNKIFTIANEDDKSTTPDNYKRIYDSIIPGRKKYVETQSQIDEAFVQTKKILIAQKKQEIIRQQMLKKSQKMSQYKN